MQLQSNFELEQCGKGKDRVGGRAFQMGLQGTKGVWGPANTPLPGMQHSPGVCGEEEDRAGSGPHHAGSSEEKKKKKKKFIEVTKILQKVPIYPHPASPTLTSHMPWYICQK